MKVHNLKSFDLTGLSTISDKSRNITDNDDDGNQGVWADGFQIMGMLNGLKAGDVRTNIIIAPMLFGWVDKLKKKSIGEPGTNGGEDQHIPQHYPGTIGWGDLTSLLKTIKFEIVLALHQVVKLKLKSASLVLTGIKDKKYYALTSAIAIAIWMMKIMMNAKIRWSEN